MRDNPLGLSRSCGSDDSSIIRVRVSSSQNSSQIITNQSTHKIIHIIDDSYLERLSGGNFSNNSTFDALFYDEDSKGGGIVNSMRTLSQVA